MDIEHLSKRGGARFTDVATYKVSCEGNQLLGKESFKSASEVGSSDQDFVHVIRSILTDHNQPVVVKMHLAGTYFIQNELAIMSKLEGYDHVVQKVCDFQCNDDKKRWQHHVRKPATFCQPGGLDKLHLIVMEYIEDGDVAKVFDSNQTKHEIHDMFLQTALTISELGAKFKVYHGDLNSGNILFEKTDKKYASYSVLDRYFRVKTHGRTPKLIDFGRGGDYDGKVQQRGILDDIYIVLSVLCNWIKDPDIKRDMQGFITSQSRENKKQLIKFLDALKSHQV